MLPATLKVLSVLILALALSLQPFYRQPNGAASTLDISMQQKKGRGVCAAKRGVNGY